MNTIKTLAGWLALTTGNLLPLHVCHSAAGFYLGTLTEEELPYTRESNEYWQHHPAVQTALLLGQWTQRLSP